MDIGYPVAYCEPRLGGGERGAWRPGRRGAGRRPGRAGGGAGWPNCGSVFAGAAICMPAAGRGRLFLELNYRIRRSHLAAVTYEARGQLSAININSGRGTSADLMLPRRLAGEHAKTAETVENFPTSTC